MKFTARQMELARWALRVGQSEASYARDNGMRLSDVQWLFELAAKDIRKEDGAKPYDVKKRMDSALDFMRRDAECVDLFFAECRMRSDGKPLKADPRMGGVLL